MNQIELQTMLSETAWIMVLAFAIGMAVAVIIRLMVRMMDFMSKVEYFREANKRRRRIRKSRKLRYTTFNYHY